MRHEKIIKNPDGSKHKIIVNIYIDRLDKIKYRTSVLKCDSGKRTFRSIPFDLYDHQWRAMSMAEREEYDNKRAIDEVGEHNLQEAKLELWQKIKP